MWPLALTYAAFGGALSGAGLLLWGLILIRPNRPLGRDAAWIATAQWVGGAVIVAVYVPLLAPAVSASYRYDRLWIFIIAALGPILVGQAFNALAAAVRRRLGK